tara:strand:+ start:3680 stop:4780 length:1101 start_codon:yes stop_codon:yes gene_type:complete
MTKKQQFQLFSLIFIILVTVLIIRNRTQEEVISFNNEDKDISIHTCSNKQVKNIEPIIYFSGKIRSVNKINIISEVNGVSNIKNTNFEVGVNFKKNDVILSIKNDDLILDLKSVKSQFLTLLVQTLPEIKMDFPKLGNAFQNYIENYSLDTTIEKLPSTNNSKEKTFLSSKQIFANYFKIKSLENKLEKFTIRAPFDGFLSRTLIDPGSNIMMGQPIGEFISNENYELISSVTLKESKLINTGDIVNIYLEDSNNYVNGKIKRIGQNINELTQSVEICINITNGEVKDGMYGSGEILSKMINNKVMIERSKIINNQVFILEDNKIKFKKINIIAFQNDSAIIDGISSNDCVLDEYRSYYYDGMNIN